MNIYVYQIDDQTYGAGFIEAVCARRGRIVERWPIDTYKQIKFLQVHSTAFPGAYDRVKHLAERAEQYTDADCYEYDEQREAMLIELASLPFKSRFKAGIKVIFGRYQEKVNVAEGNN